MIVRIIGIVLIAIAALALAAQSSAPMGADQSKILALEHAWNVAETNKDTKALDLLIDNTLVYVDYDGTYMGKEDFLSSAKAPSLQPAEIVNESTTVHMYGNAAVVTGIYREKGKANGKPYFRRGRFTDTWLYLNNTWKCVASQSTLISH
jgi:ketosteroid isomerase-like protein